ncbi:filamin-a [Plakobranchus ocellatus]|uniref:Filamin-a n=1 Tax=Plakobranchus ocellatus TaxID=259542 RepID=A0AAV3YAD8_9GAST|nr:filamin-a [Plakobranchus ocellatus]
MPLPASEDQWIAIQQKTFTNWANEQLRIGNRSVEDLAVDLCDGVRLVALVEALQFQKIGKVYQKPTNRIQMLHNVSLALQAVAEDNVRLVNIGNDDIVDGNLKLTLGLLWHLILRYQISSARAAPPRKLMLSWFRAALPEELDITNLTSGWRDGCALHALLDHCKPGLSPHWRQLNKTDAVLNIETAMRLAKEKLGIPRVISAEDFASPGLDELSAMTYLSYFIRQNSPGYHSTLDWVCRQLKTTNVTNFTTDWNDGQVLCKLVHSLGGDIPGWPKLDKPNNVARCQLGLDAAQALGVPKTLTASELADPRVDHLTVMTYVAQFQNVTPRLPKAQRCRLDCPLHKVTVGNEAKFRLKVADPDIDSSKLVISVAAHAGRPPCKVEWSNGEAICSFVPTEIGQHVIHASYDGDEITGSPVMLSAVRDLSKVKTLTQKGPLKLGQPFEIEVTCPDECWESVELRCLSPAGQMQILSSDRTTTGLKTMFVPSSVGVWSYQTNVGSQEVDTGKVRVFDPGAAQLTGPETGEVGEEVRLSVNVKNCGSQEVDVELQQDGGQSSKDVKISPSGDMRYLTLTPCIEGKVRVKVTMHGENIRGSPKVLQVVDRGQIQIVGDGIVRGMKDMEASFTVDTRGIPGDVSADIRRSGLAVPVSRQMLSAGVFRFCYVPDTVGVYSVNVLCASKHLPGSPYQVKVTDKSQVKPRDDLSAMQDENGRLALRGGQTTVLSFDVKHAGPGTFNAEVLSPEGKLPVQIDQNPQSATVSFLATKEGDHYVHLYWSDSPIDASPILAFCPGPQLPVDATMVVISGKGAETARATLTTDFMIDGRRAGPGVPKVQLQGVHTDVTVELEPLQYDRYRCLYTAPHPGAFLLYVYWSDALVHGCPIKVTVTPRGDPRKVKVKGSALGGGVAGQEWTLLVDTAQAGPGDVAATLYDDTEEMVTCKIAEQDSGQFLLSLLPVKIGLYTLHVTYDNSHVGGSPFSLYAGSAPDPTQVRVFGPGIEDGIVGEFESRFLVETQGAGAGQLAVKIRGPRGAFKVEMRRETETERTINCRYDPSEPGEYEIHVRWSGDHVPGSPFIVHLAETRDQLEELTNERGFLTREERMMGWRAEI